MPKETVGEAVHLVTADHPKRTDSPEYKASRRMLMNTLKGGCVVCGGVPDLSHPELALVADSHGLQDHHGGGLYVDGVLVAFNLFGTEWSLGWSADPKIVAAHVANLNVVLHRLGLPTYDAPIDTTADVMAWVDSIGNANVKLCAPHHVGRQEQDTKDANGHQAVGIHEIPMPIWLGQVTAEWDRWDMWAGTTGTLALAHPNAHDGHHATVLHSHPVHHPGVSKGDHIPPHHPLHQRAALAA